MNWKKDALRLTKKYATGASCKIDFKNVENTMFYPHYEAIAEKMDLHEITVDVVREYWLKIHNGIIIAMFKARKASAEEAKICMVRPRKSGKKFFAVHGNKTVDILTPEQAEVLKKEIQKTPKSLR